MHRSKWIEDPDGNIVPDFIKSASIMESEYKALTYEEYVLVKHCGLNRNDLVFMTQEDRNMWIKFLQDELEKERDEIKKANKKSK